jgi:flagellar L-ring protein precursor FlgH
MKRFGPKLGVLLCLLTVSTANTFAESLFRVSTEYQAQANDTTVAMAPRSLFTQPRPCRIGDIVSLNLNDQQTMQDTVEVKIARTNTLNENGTGLLNSAITSTLGKVPVLGKTLQKTVAPRLALPSFNGLNNATTLDSKANSNRIRNVTQMIPCQVVQVLPNGNLMIQGHKVSMMNKEQMDIIVTGVVNPYYIDQNNTIDSRYVANLQLMSGGRGILSRQQSDGIANKIYQFIN